MRLEPLYHWAPSERRTAILKGGLVPYSAPVVHGATGEADERLAFAYLCFGLTAQTAWAYSAASRDGLEDEFDGWDLWQVWPGERAAMHALPHWGPEIQEVRITNAVPADRLWYVATRRSLSAEAPE